jgi:hypothetical protein
VSLFFSPTTWNFNGSTCRKNIYIPARVSS